MFKKYLNNWKYGVLKDYEPVENEEFMSLKQLAYFRNRLEIWHKEILNGSAETMKHLKSEEKKYPDMTDRATQETERNMELRERDRQRKFIVKIEAALKRIEDGTYGYCEETGEPIGIKRLIARPVATLSIEAQEKHERNEKIYSSD